MLADATGRNNERTERRPQGALPPPIPPTGRELSVSFLLGMCRRHLLLIAVWVAVVLAITVVVVYSLQPRYRAEATLIIDTRVQQITNLKSAVSTPFTTQDTAPAMRNEVQILNSPDLAAQVIEKLNLAAAPSFIQKPVQPSPIMVFLRDWCVRIVGESCAKAPPAPFNAMRSHSELVNTYLSRLSVFNDGRSFALSVGFQDVDPKLAAEIVRTHVDLYLADQRALKQRTSIAGVRWIDEQLKRLGATLASKQQELQRLREGAGLIYTRGSTVLAQQVADINAQLIQARADQAQRQARLPGRSDNRTGGASVQSEVLNSPLIQALRGQESQARQTLDEMRQSRGADFPGIAAARARVDQVSSRIASETARIVAATNGDANVAGKRVSELEQALARLQTQLVTQDQASAKVAEMERDVTGTRAVYQGLLERQQELEAQAGTEQADARLVSSATEPLAPFFPNKTIMLSLGLLLGTVSAVGAAFVIDKPERGIQLPSTLQALFGLRALTPLPQVAPRRYRRRLPDFVLDQPRSEFAEAIRSLRGDIATLQTQRPVKVLAITSALPKEGKTSVAASLARSMVASGLHVLLIDGDLRRSSVGAALNVRCGARGIVSVLKRECKLSDAITKDPRTALDLLMVDKSDNSPQDLLGGSAFQALLNEARATYDFVVVDTPPQGAVSDVLLMAEFVDATLMAVRWNATPPTVVRWTLEAFGTRGLMPQGIFLNGVDYPSLTKKDPDVRTAYRSTRSYYPS